MKKQITAFAFMLVASLFVNVLSASTGNVPHDKPKTQKEIANIDNADLSEQIATVYVSVEPSFADAMIVTPVYAVDNEAAFVAFGNVKRVAVSFVPIVTERKEIHKRFWAADLKRRYMCSNFNIDKRKIPICI
jgi:hypothetical protein